MSIIKANTNKIAMTSLQAEAKHLFCGKLLVCWSHHLLLSEEIIIMLVKTIALVIIIIMR